MKITSLVELRYFLIQQRYKIEERIRQKQIKSFHRDYMIADMATKEFIDFLLERIEIIRNSKE